MGLSQKTILYISDYLGDEIINERKIQTYSPACNNKIIGIARSLVSVGYSVIMLSSGWKKEFSNKKYAKKEVILENNIKVIYLPLRDSFFINFIVALYYKVKETIKLVKTNNIEAVLFYNFRLKTALPSYLLKYLFKKEIILEFEESFCHSINKSFILNYFIEKVGRKLVDGAILSTTLLKKRLSSNIPFCVVRGFYTPLNLSTGNVIPEVKTIMYGGKWDNDRGIDVFTNSLKFIKNRVNIVITGYGPYSNKLFSEVYHIKKNRSNINITVHEIIDREKYLQLLSASDILINPQKMQSGFGSVSFPSKLYEYMSAGKIIISSNISDISLFSQNRIVIYNEDKPEILANKIDYIIENYTEYLAYALNSFNWVKNDGSYINVGNRILTLIKQSISD